MNLALVNLVKNIRDVVFNNLKYYTLKGIVNRGEMKKYKVTIEDSEGFVAVYSDIEEKDFLIELNNDLDQPPNVLGSLEPASWYSKGFDFLIRGYVKNPKEKEDYEKAVDKTIKNSGLV